MSVHISPRRDEGFCATVPSPPLVHRTVQNQNSQSVQKENRKQAPEPEIQDIETDFSLLPLSSSSSSSSKSRHTIVPRLPIPTARVLTPLQLEIENLNRKKFNAIIAQIIWHLRNQQFEAVWAAVPELPIMDLTYSLHQVLYQHSRSLLEKISSIGLIVSHSEYSVEHGQLSREYAFLDACARNSTSDVVAKRGRVTYASVQGSGIRRPITVFREPMPSFLSRYRYELSVQGSTQTPFDSLQMLFTDDGTHLNFGENTQYVYLCESTELQNAVATKIMKVFSMAYGESIVKIHRDAISNSSSSVRQTGSFTNGNSTLIGQVELVVNSLTAGPFSPIRGLTLEQSTSLLSQSYLYHLVGTTHSVLFVNLKNCSQRVLQQIFPLEFCDNLRDTHLKVCCLHLYKDDQGQPRCEMIEFNNIPEGAFEGRFNINLDLSAFPRICASNGMGPVVRVWVDNERLGIRYGEHPPFEFSRYSSSIGCYTDIIQGMLPIQVPSLIHTRSLEGRMTQLASSGNHVEAKISRFFCTLFMIYVHLRPFRSDAIFSIPKKGDPFIGYGFCPSSLNLIAGYV